VEHEERDVGRTVDEIAADSGHTPAASGGSGGLAGGNFPGGPGEGGADDEVGAGGARPGPGQGQPSDSDGDGARHPQSPHGSGPELR
jgi:hypothetical protein